MLVVANYCYPRFVDPLQHAHDDAKDPHSITAPLYKLFLHHDA